MERHIATKLLRDELDKYNLNSWSIRLNQSDNTKYFGFCSHKDECIILSSHYIDQFPEPEVLNTIRHEVAHAICGPRNGHNEIWEAKAREIGCTSVAPCSSFSLSPAVIDAIRSGADVEITFETETIHRPKYKITLLQDKCPVCNKIAKETKSNLVKIDNPTKPDKKFSWLECGHLIVKDIPKGTPFGSLISNWWKDEISSCTHEWDKNACIKCLEFKPFPFQVEGSEFLESALATSNGGAVFDEMGLGKTIQSLAYLKYHPESFPVLFVVKSGIKLQWCKEILRWLGVLHSAQVIMTSQDLIIPNLKSYVISYDMLVSKIKKSKKTGKIIKSGFDGEKLSFIKTIVLDEVQQIKNPDSARTKAIRLLCKDKQVIALSGTPWKNRGSEFFTILNILAPMKFPSYQGFLDRWVDFYYEGDQIRQGGINRPDLFKEYIKDIAIRREVSDVSIQMPDVVRTLHYTELDNYSQNTYNDEVSDFVKYYNEKVIGGEEDDFETSTNMLARLARMRHITGLAKIPATIEFAEEFAESNDRKLTIFVHHIDVGNILYEQMKTKFPNIPILQLTGSQDGAERFKIQEEFANSKRAFLIASTLASGEGINLQTCGDAILHERQWNPQNEDQAAPGRFRRIGATHKTVNVTFMTAAGTVDEILAGIVERKRAYFHNAMNKGEMPIFNERSMAKELAEGIVKNFNSITKKAKL
jgi:superfamily II DNA or RNA helicase